MKKLGYFIEDNLKDDLLAAIKKRRPHGNGRAMKDMVEGAIQQQAYRILQGKQENRADLTKLEKEDFVILTEGENN